MAERGCAWSSLPLYTSFHVPRLVFAVAHILDHLIVERVCDGDPLQLGQAPRASQVITFPEFKAGNDDVQFPLPACQYLLALGMIPLGGLISHPMQPKIYCTPKDIPQAYRVGIFSSTGSALSIPSLWSDFY